MKANKVYLHKLKTNDFVDRFEEEIEFKGTTMKEMAEAFEHLSRMMRITPPHINSTY